MLTTYLLLVTTFVGQAEAPAKEQNFGIKTPDQDDLAVKVKTLVRQLDSDEQAKREAAEKALVALGPDVMPHLPTLGPQTPAEVRNRLARVRAALVSAAVEAATKPTTVTLSGEMSLSEAMKAVEKQTGNKFVDYRDRFNQEERDPKIKVELDKAPFWKAMDTILDAAELTIYNFDEESGALAYVARGDASPRLGRAAYSGLFRLEPVRIDATRDLKSPENTSLRLTVDVSWEPRLSPIVLQQPLGDVTAKDENGGELAVDRREGEIEVPVDMNNAGVELEIPLDLPPRGVKQIASIKGKLVATVPGKLETFTFKNLDRAKSVSQERAGVTVILEEARKNGDIFDVQIRVRFDKAANALESHRGWIYNNPCQLLDAKGNPIENAGLEATVLQLNEMGMSYKFDLEGASLVGSSFVYQTPAAIMKVPVEFELKDVDLP
jgi:hypothetical protein